MGPGKWLLVGLGTALIAIGVAAQTGTPGHPPAAAARGEVQAAHAAAPSAPKPTSSPNVAEVPKAPGLSWTSLGGTSTAALAVSSWGSDRMDVFVRGGDNALWQQTWTGGTWTGWHSLGGVLGSGPAAVSWGPGHIDVFARGADQGLWHIAWNGTQWSGWESIGGSISSAPAVSSWGGGRLDVFVRGDDGAMWHIWRAGQNAPWSDWQTLGGQFQGDPAAVASGDGRIDVLVRGLDDSLWRTAWNGSAWSAWAPNGGRLAGSPSVASCGAGRLEAFASTADQRLRLWTFDGGSGAWRDLGPSMNGLAAICERGLGTITLLGVGSDQSVQTGILRSTR